MKTPKKAKSPLESALENLFGDDDDQLGLISSLRKLFERNKKVKSVEISLEDVSKMLQSVISARVTKENPQE